MTAFDPEFFGTVCRSNKVCELLKYVLDFTNFLLTMIVQTVVKRGN